jgi:hypothetical protein
MRVKIPILSDLFDRLVKKRLQEFCNVQDTLREVMLQKFFDKVRDIILNDDILLSAMAKQRIILLKQNRKPIAIFISKDIFDTIILSKVSFPFDMFNQIYKGKIPITYIAKIPVYVSTILTEAPLLVVGSIIWKSFNNISEA